MSMPGLDSVGRPSIGQISTGAATTIVPVLSSPIQTQPPLRGNRDSAYRVALAASGEFRVILPIIPSYGWFAPFSIPTTRPKLPARHQQFFAFSPLPVVSFGWFDNLSDPVRGQKLGLRAHEQQVLTLNPLPFVSFGWFEEMSKPRTLEQRGIRSELQQAFAFEPNPVVSFGWFDNLSDPVRIKPGLKAALQRPFTTDTDVIPTARLLQWYANFSEPVRIKPGLKASLQQFLAAPSRLIPTPTSFGILDAIETKDTMLAGTMVWNRATDTEIGVINTTPQPAEIAVYPSPQAAGTITVRISIVIA
jgi:hypothetical protein